MLKKENVLAAVLEMHEGSLTFGRQGSECKVEAAEHQSLKDETHENCPVCVTQARNKKIIF